MPRHVFEFIRNSMFGSSPDHAKREWKASDSWEPPWVLLVEDDASFSTVLKTRLESHGVAVIRAFDGTDGIRSAFKYPADAIILDVEMPNGAGDELLQLLKESDSTQQIPVIVLTGRRDRVLQQKMLHLGAAAYLTKPLDFSKLQQELAKHIDIMPQTASRTVDAGALP